MKSFKALALAAIMVMPLTTWAQDELETTVDADIVSQYMWRGTEQSGFAIQPEIGLKWQGLKFSIDGSVPFKHEETTEINITLGYERWGFNVGVIDYWTKDVDVQNRYFYYDKENGGHQFEANLGYTCKYGSLQAYTIFYGPDAKINGDRAYSTYVELSVPFKFGTLDWEFKAGITPMESAGYTTDRTVKTIWGDVGVKDPHYTYAEGFACNLASIRATKEARIGNLSLPIFAELHTNPYLKKANLLFGVTIRPF